jgi:hypothetical protein
VFPEHGFQVEQRNIQFPRGFWEHDDNIQELISNVEKKLNITNKEEWYNVSMKQLKVHIQYLAILIFYRYLDFMTLFSGEVV